ncbi:MAG: hypothetical protein PHI33_09220 [Smithellaceae bacterium]|nr:hypothetical protein [Smithellaceae bacterium]
MKKITTEQLVRKCFYKGLNHRIQFFLANVNATTCCSSEVFPLIVRAARRFVRLEEQLKKDAERKRDGEKLRDL